MEHLLTDCSRLCLVLLDDHEAAGAALVLRLRRHGRLTVVGDTPDPEVAVRLVREHRPHAVLVDTMREDRRGLEAVSRLAALDPPVRPAIVVHVASRHLGDWPEARAAGADEILLKDFAADTLAGQLAPIVRRVLAPERWPTV
ncbi:MAG: response regulator [Dehalococcoidia bacterium]